MLAEGENSGSLARINRELIAQAEAIDPPQRVVLDWTRRDSGVRSALAERLQRLHRVHLL